jgi:hypothetical protein
MRALKAAGIVCFALMVSLPASARAQMSANEQLADRAEAAFRQGVENKTRFVLARRSFSEAADAYVELHQQGVRSPALYRNLGNAALLADRWPIALWACHVGLAIDPNDRALRDQLAFVRAKVRYPASYVARPEADSWPLWLHRPTILELSGITAFSYVLTCIAAACAFFRRTFRLYCLTAFALLVSAAFGIALWHAVEQAEHDRQTPLVIVVEPSSLYRGNGASYPYHPGLPVLPRGLEVRQRLRRGNWLHVRLTSGEVGWLPIERVRIVEP